MAGKLEYFRDAESKTFINKDSCQSQHFSLARNSEPNGAPTEIQRDKGVQMSDTEENTFYKELQALISVKYERLKAGGKNELLETTSHEKFCCCPSAQCYTCKNGRAGNVQKKTATSDSGPSCFWRVPNECPCFGTNNQGEVRGTIPTRNRLTGGTIVATNHLWQQTTCSCSPASKYFFPNHPLRISKLLLTTPNTNNCYPYVQIGKHSLPFFDPCKRYTLRKCQTPSQPSTLGSPVGVLKSSSLLHNTSAQLKQIDRLVTYIKSLGLIYLKNVKKWQPIDLEILMEQEHELHKEDNTNSDDGLKPVNQYIESVTSSFIFRGYKFKIDMNEGVWTESLHNLYAALKLFFLKSDRYCLIQLRNWYLLIWRQDTTYFVLDLNGRNILTLEGNTREFDPEALPMLICLRELINVVHLIVNMSNLQENEPYLIREIMVAELVTPEGRVFKRQFHRTGATYYIVDDNYAFLLSNLHLSLNYKQFLLNRSALPVGIAAMLSSKIDHPATWDTKMIDRIICYGVNVYRSCLEYNLDWSKPINLHTFPNCLRLGQFLINFTLDPQAYVGDWKCTPGAVGSTFGMVLEKALKENDFILFQINNQMYAIWKKTGFYYLLDSYRHLVWGMTEDEEVMPTKKTTSSIRMFRYINSLLKVFHHILIQSNRSAIFYIHKLIINSIRECSNCNIEPITTTIKHSVTSLNEYIWFEENCNICLDELEKISDYEIDVESNISSIKSEESSIMVHPEEEGDEEDETGLKINLNELKYPENSKSKTKLKKKQSGSKKNEVSDNKQRKISAFIKRTGRKLTITQKKTLRIRPKNAKGQKASFSNVDDIISPEKQKSKNSKTRILSKKIGGLVTSSDSKVNHGELYQSEDNNQKMPKLIDVIRRVISEGKVESNLKRYKSKVLKTKPNYRERKSILSYKNNIKKQKHITTIPKTQEIEDTNSKLTAKNESYVPRKLSSIAFIQTDERTEIVLTGIMTPTNENQQTNFLKYIDRQMYKNKSKRFGNDAADSDSPSNIFKKTYREPRRANRFTLISRSIRNDAFKTINQSSLVTGESSIGQCEVNNKLCQNENSSLTYERHEIHSEPHCVHEGGDWPYTKRESKSTTDIVNERQLVNFSCVPKQIFSTNLMNCTYESICKALCFGFRCSDRVLITTDWGNFVVFYVLDSIGHIYFIHDGCTCHPQQFQHLNVSSSAGLLPFSNLHDVISYIQDTREMRILARCCKINLFDDICKLCLYASVLAR